MLEQATWIDRIIPRILTTPEDVVYVSGSIAEGFGNSGSDLDVFLVTSDERTISEWASLGGFSTALVGYGSSYIDYERHQWQEMQELGNRLNSLAPEDYDSVWRLPYSQLDLYYRTSIGEAKHSPRRFETLLASFRPDVSRALLATWCGLRYAMQWHACQKAIEADDWTRAYFSAHNALQSGLDFFLAREGEGYTGLKWRFEKIERRFGRDSDVYRAAWDLKSSGERSPQEYVRQVLAFLETLELTSYLSWSIASLNPKAKPDCRLFTLAGQRYLFQNKTKTFRVSDRGAFIWEHLDGKHSRPEIASALASRFDVEPEAAANELEQALQAFRHADLILEG